MSADALPRPSAEAAEHSLALAALIRARIERSGGWIDFAQYMDLALYAPGLGYYVAGSTKLGGTGDFVTAPELTPLFARTLARGIAPLLDEGRGGDLLELGAGSGALACGLLRALDEAGALPRRYGILELSPELRQRQAARIAALPGELASRVHWLESLPDRIDGVVLGNEVLDALPVHLVVWDAEGVRQRGVIVRDGGFAFEDRPVLQGPLCTHAQALPVSAPYVSEINLRASALVDALARRLGRGALLFIDYGFGRAEYYHPQRVHGTLMCHYRHRAHDDVFFLPGLQDITAHVDFTAVAEVGIARGMQLLGYTTQAAYLIDLGITDLLARAQPGTVEYLRQVAPAQKLLSPAEMGELFKVIALGRDVSPPPGFSRGNLSRLL